MSSSVALERIWPETDGLRPFDFRFSPLDNDRWYYISRAGLIHTFKPGETPSIEALDIRANIGRLAVNNTNSPGGSQQWGLISFAFAPDFAISGRIYVVYTGNTSDPSIPLDDTRPISRLSRFTLDPADAEGLRFDPASEKVLIEQQQTGAEHHFDHVAFGPGGYLYLSAGDGTSNTSTAFLDVPSQLLNDVRGKILRLDVNVPGDDARGYSIPPENPFADGVNGLPEIYAVGLRNPWRFSFDGDDLWIGDAGASTWEEVNRIKIGSISLPNFGWNPWEGVRCRIPEVCDDPSRNFIRPVDTYDGTDQVSAVIGGAVYRGSLLPQLSGRYVFSIYGQNKYFAITVSDDGGSVTKDEIVPATTAAITAFFTDKNNELYGVAQGGTNAGVYRFVPVTGAHSGSAPKLSQTGCVSPTNPLSPSKAMIPYSLTAELWSDGASKQRYFAIPDGSTIKIKPDGDFEFPSGSVLMKSFMFNGAPHETRLLKRHDDGSWAGYSYRWNEAHTDADLVGPLGEVASVATPSGALNWRYPSRTECMLCHTPQVGFAIGPETALLNRLARGGHQLASFRAMGLLDPIEGLPAPIHDLPAYSVTAPSRHVSARAYLHANCASCHHGDDSGTRAFIDLRFSSANVDPATVLPLDEGGPRTTNLCNVLPGVSDLGIVGARLLKPGDIGGSVLYQRMARRGDGQMPPLASQRIHTNGLSRVRAWIRRPDVCANVGDFDADGVPDNYDNCIERPNASQWDSDHDGFGNACDADFNQSGGVEEADRVLLVEAKGGACDSGEFSQFGRAPYQERFDLNFDGLINQTDCSLFSELDGAAPGPAASR